MNIKKNRTLNFFSTIALLLCCYSLSLNSHAQGLFNLDRSQPIRINADQSEHFEKTLTTSYSGNVIIVQGTLKIEADMVIFSNQAQARTLKAIGRPGNFQQRDSNTGEMISAQAQELFYRLNDGILELNGDAQITQHGRSISGTHISYFVDEQRVLAQASHPKTQTKQRVEVIIPATDKAPE